MMAPCVSHTVMFAAARTLVAFGAILPILGGGSALAQTCGEQWLSLGSLPGVDRPVAALKMWDPDGPGPETPKLIIAGEFATAGNALASNIVAYDPDTGLYTPLGAGLNGPVNALAQLPSGELVAGGAFTTAGGAPASLVARWDGSTWSPIGAGLASAGAGSVYSLALLPNGELIAGGRFTSSNGNSLKNVARWNGTAWVAMNGGLAAGGTAYAMTLTTTGGVAVGGDFSTADGVTANSIAAWTGSAWLPFGMGLGPARPIISAMATLSNGDLLASGSFTTINNASGKYFARWHSSAWSAITPTPNSTAFAFKLLPSGKLLVGGDFTKVGETDLPHVAMWDGANWTPMGSVNDIVTALEVLPNGDIVAGGWFKLADGKPALHVARWDGSKWNALGSGLSFASSLLAVLPGDDLVANTRLQTDAPGPLFPVIAERFNGSSWSALTPEGTPGLVNLTAVEMLTDGAIAASGERAGTGERVVARWNGTAWVTLGAIDLPVQDIIALPGGGMLVAGSFTAVGGVPANRVARWDGTQWSALGAGVNNTAFAVAQLSNNDIIVAGAFTSAGGSPASRIARWDGTQWSPLAAGLNGTVRSLALLPGGDLVACGSFNASGSTPAACIARWDGLQWSPLGAGLNQAANALAVLPSGDLVVGGTFTTAGGAPANRLARWNGSQWLPYGGGMNGAVNALALRSSGELVATGDFTIADGKPVAFIARLASSGAPTMSVQPEPTIVDADATLTLAATPSNGYADVASQWFRGESAISDGPGGASSGGGLVSGAQASLTSPTDNSPATLVIEHVRPSDAGLYSVRFSNACGAATSVAVEVKVRLCAADVDANGTVDSFDFFAFLACWDQTGACADLDKSGDVDLSDFFLFFDQFDKGCGI